MTHIAEATFTSPDRVRESADAGGGELAGWGSGAPADGAGRAAITIEALPGRCIAVVLPVPDDSGSQPCQRLCFRRLRPGALRSANPHPSIRLKLAPWTNTQWPNVDNKSSPRFHKVTDWL